MDLCLPLGVNEGPHPGRMCASRLVLFQTISPTRSSLWVVVLLQVCIPGESPPNGTRTDFRLSPVFRLAPAGAFEPSTTIRPEPHIKKASGSTPLVSLDKCFAE
jgi:hypothetical protein